MFPSIDAFEAGWVQCIQIGMFQWINLSFNVAQFRSWIFASAHTVLVRQHRDVMEHSLEFSSCVALLIHSSLSKFLVRTSRETNMASSLPWPYRLRSRRGFREIDIASAGTERLVCSLAPDEVHNRPCEQGQHRWVQVVARNTPSTSRTQVQTHPKRTKGLPWEKEGWRWFCTLDT